MKKILMFSLISSTMLLACVNNDGCKGNVSECNEEMGEQALPFIKCKMDNNSTKEQAVEVQSDK